MRRYVCQTHTARSLGNVTWLTGSALVAGSHSKGLVPGADCPERASFVDVAMLGENMTGPALNKRAMCVFEQNSGDPLRRHSAYSSFYGGMADSLLVVRVAMAIYNYDYIIDFRFH